MDQKVLNEQLLTAEQGVLGSMLIDEETVGPMLIAVSDEDFQALENRNIFRAFRELYGQGRAPDPILVNEHLGGSYGKYLAELMEVTPTAANADAYAKALKEASRLWRLRNIGGQMLQAEDLDQARALTDAANLLLSERSGVRRVDMRQGLREFFIRHDERNKPKDFLKWGIAKLDETLHIGGGDMVVIGGSPSAGKTALALQLAFHIGKSRKVGFFSYETDDDKLVDRTVTCQTMVSYGKIMAGRMAREDLRTVYEMRSHLEQSRLEYLEVNQQMTVSGIGSYAMAHHYDVIVVDYLQKIPAASRGRTPSEFERVSQVSSDLQQLGRQTGKTIIALSQLRRQEKTDKNGDIKEMAPTMSSLRQSGQIEQDADAVLLLYRETPKGPGTRRCLDIAKNKDGLAGVGALLDFDGDNQRFRQSNAQWVPEKPQEPKVKQMGFQDLQNDNGPSPFNDGEGAT